MFAHEIDGLAQDGQVREAQEVELEQAQRLDGMHLVLAHQPVRVRRLLERHELRQRLSADDDAGRMGRRVAGDPFKVPREVRDSLDRRITLDKPAQLGRSLDRLLKPDPKLIRNGLGDAVHLAIGMAQDAPDVADGGPREHRAEGDDLGHVILAVLAPDVGDDLLAPTVLEIHVDVRHRHPVRVEEALERELIEDRIDRRDTQRVGHDGARRGATTGRLDALLAGEPDEVRHDQEVARVTHRQDDPELVVEASLEFRRDRPVAALQATLAFRPEPALDGLPLGDREVRDTQLAEGQ